MTNQKYWYLIAALIVLNILLLRVFQAIGVEPDSANGADVTIHGKVALRDSCTRIVVLHDWEPINIAEWKRLKYKRPEVWMPSQYPEPDSTWNLEVHKAFYCRKCGVLRIDLKGAEK